MRAASEIRTGIGILIAIQLVLTFGVMGLLVRMSPAIERIVAENVRSITAVEEMYRSLAVQQCVPEAQAVEQFQAAYLAASANVTLEGEAELVEGIGDTWPEAIEGECDALIDVTHRLQGLSDLNRQGMDKADEQAQRLGVAGTWAAALLGLLAFATSALITRRLVDRMAQPLGEIEAVLAAVHLGDPYRRARRMDAPVEYGAISTRLNQLLDRRLAREEEEDPQLANIDRALLHHLLDRMPEPVVAVDSSGAIIAASDSALDILASSGIESLSDALSVTPQGHADGISMISDVQPFGKQDGFLITLHALEPQLPPLEGAGGAEPGGRGGSEPEPPRQTAPSVPFVNPMADRGAADERTDIVKPEPRTDDKPDWERD